MFFHKAKANLQKTQTFQVESTSSKGQFVGFSDEQSTLVADVHHSSIIFISSQFHVVFNDLFETVIRTGDDEPIIESICQHLFCLDRELYLEEEHDDATIFYQPPLLYEVWLDKLNYDMVPKITFNNGVGMTDLSYDDDDPILLPISDEDSVDSSLCSRDSESAGGIWDNQYIDDVSIAPEGAQLIPPNDDGNSAPLVGSPVGRNIGPEREAAQPVPNIVPAPIQAPEGDTRRRCEKAKQYPPAMWRRGADCKLERITMNIV